MKPKGSFTVEAALIMPFVLGSMFLMICLCLYLHDRSILASAAAECAGKTASEKYCEEQGLEARAKGQLYGLVETRLLVVKSLQATAAVTDNEVTISYSGQIRLLGGLMVTGVQSAKRVSPVTRIRYGHQLGDLWEKVRE